MFTSHYPTSKHIQETSQGRGYAWNPLIILETSEWSMYKSLPVFSPNIAYFYISLLYHIK